MAPLSSAAPPPGLCLTLHLHRVLRTPVLHRGRGRTFQLLSIQVLPLLLAVPETENQAVELGKVGAGTKWEFRSPLMP